MPAPSAGRPDMHPPAGHVRLAEACGLPAADHGLLRCELGRGGAHVTLATADVEYLQRLGGVEAMAGLAIPTDNFPLGRAGWPDEWEPVPEPEKLWFELTLEDVARGSLSLG